MSKVVAVYEVQTKIVQIECCGLAMVCLNPPREQTNTSIPFTPSNYEYICSKCGNRDKSLVLSPKRIEELVRIS